MVELKNAEIYGVSSKYEFGRWNHVVYGPFKNEKEANEWLNKEEYDFRERELMNESEAIKLAGSENVSDAQVNLEGYRITARRGW